MRQNRLNLNLSQFMEGLLNGRIKDLSANGNWLSQNNGTRSLSEVDGKSRYMEMKITTEGENAPEIIFQEVDPQ